MSGFSDDLVDPRALTPTGRRLEVLAVLQAQPGISAARLAERLGVTERTARRDVAHLRDLGYRVDAEAGRYGGYTLAAGRAVPPLLLDADEVLAVGVALRSAVAVDGTSTAAVTALAKLTESVPSRLRSRLDALAHTESAPVPWDRTVDPAVLMTLAHACRNVETVRVRHRRAPSAEARPRDLQPYRVVQVAARWYLVAYDPAVPAWRTYALDRIDEVSSLGRRSAPPDPPDDAVAFVTETLAQRFGGHRVRVRMLTSADLVRRLVPPTVGSVEADGEDCVVTLRTEDLDWAARWLVARNVDFDVIEPLALVDRIRALGEWLVARYPAG
ncbi:helix-turn-helix transcriptional regulator [Mumia sp. DW29H23]|uniref:helix-turn-helix transcriptional regulator n=1 Tax=Mumia sp. DW29H23 TaxID=3421241 RepID=UPI003D68CE55